MMPRKIVDSKINVMRAKSGWPKMRKAYEKVPRKLSSDSLGICARPRLKRNDEMPCPIYAYPQ